jgi:hypothetical protein
MARAYTPDPIALHRAWIGLLQPDGIVASAAALADAGLAPDPLQQHERERLRALCTHNPADPDNPRLLAHDGLRRFFTDILGVDPEWIHDSPPQLTRRLIEFNAEELAPTYALANPNLGTAHADRPWLCLLKVVPAGFSLDKAHGLHSDTHWVASPLAKMERLLRETDIPLGVVANDTELRVVYAPPGEGTGVLAFPFALLLGPESDLCLGALVMLLGRARWLDATPDDAPARDRDKQYLPHLLEESRKYQNTVSTALAEQVLDALWALLQGVEAADVAAQRSLLRDWRDAHADEIYGGLLTVLLRLVFLLYAEDRGQLPSVGFYPESYGVRALYEKLRDDAGRHPDTMNLRLGAWARLLATFRLVHDGGGHGAVKLPPREGALFSPDTYPFLEGRPRGSVAQRGESLDVPAVGDGVVFQVLEKLLRVDREDLSYKTLGVEELGAVYESMMGFTVLTTTGPSLALKPDHVVVDLHTLLATPGKDRAKLLDTLAGATVPAKSQDALRTAATVDALAEALAKSRSPRTPAVVPVGALVLQPTAERRRSGSHYTPRALTAPIVQRTLGPVFDALGPRPSHAQILGLAVCDPAMGSGAFLVAACRWLGDKLYDVWQRDGGRDKPLEVARISPDDDERVVARRLVAQHCLYGVDKNPFAVDLARLSLWLETLAREHPFTFLDHCLREGDSLVGVSRAQMERVALVEAPRKSAPDLGLVGKRIRDGLTRAQADRAAIRRLALSDDTGEKRRLLDEANAAVAFARQLGDALVGAFFAETSAGARKKSAERLRGDVVAAVSDDLLQAVLDRARGALPLRPFHWEVEFPEVFARDNPGFDAMVGNPPFIGGTTISTHLGLRYHHGLMALHDATLGNADIVAFFARSCFQKLRESGTLGLIATNTIAQGDTREVGLRHIRANGGCIYWADTRYVWPGMAAVVVTIFHAIKGKIISPAKLDGRNVETIGAFLAASAADNKPLPIPENKNRAYVGSKIWGSGFIFEKNNSNDSNSVGLLARLLKEDPRNEQVISRYMGGEELNNSPSIEASRWVINFGEMTFEEAARWPEIFSIVEQKVKPARANNKQRNYRDEWWLHSTRVPQVTEYVDKHHSMLALCKLSPHLAVTFAYKNTVYADTIVLILHHEAGAFSIMQSRVHEAWARFFGSSMKDDLRYTPSDCFETFPFPRGWQDDATLDALGARYHAERAAWMVAHDLGLTKFYNAFHDPDTDDAGVVALRALHAEMDRAVLRAYGWNDLADTLTTDFVLDHADDADAPSQGSGRTRKKPWRLRWPEATRDAVLGRLLALNAERAAGGGPTPPAPAPHRGAGESRED